LFVALGFSFNLLLFVALLPLPALRLFGFGLVVVASLPLAKSFSSLSAVLVDIYSVVEG
jgi:hypothetical protein